MTVSEVMERKLHPGLASFEADVFNRIATLRHRLGGRAIKLSHFQILQVLI